MLTNYLLNTFLFFKKKNIYGLQMVWDWVHQELDELSIFRVKKIRLQLMYVTLLYTHI